jgi:hypothetical protein
MPSKILAHIDDGSDGRSEKAAYGSKCNIDAAFLGSDHVTHNAVGKRNSTTTPSTLYTAKGQKDDIVFL